jgi:hypothetical protein
MPKMVTNPSASLPPGTRAGKIEPRYLAWFSLLVIAGGVGSLYPVFLLACLAAAGVLGLCWLGIVALRRAHLELWQMLTLMAVSGYVILNYGFENWTLHVGPIPVILPYAMMYAALGMVLLGRRPIMPMAWREPAVVCVFILFAMACMHLVFDVPAYGLYAIRDASMCIDGLFILVGLAWALKPHSIEFLLKWLLVVFVINTLYSYTLPWGERIWAWSPESGVFMKVPILGSYAGSGDILLAGALFCLCLGDYVLTRPRWLMPVFGAVQLLGIAITQVRRMYLAIFFIAILLILFGEVKKSMKLLALVPVGLIVLVLATTFGGLKISGRVGPVELSFFKDHLRSISGAEDTPGSDPESRVKMASQAMQHFYGHPVLGEGFGQALTTEIDMTNGAITRMPHNSSITYLARLGVVGIIVWIVFHFSLIRPFIIAIRQRKTFPDKRLYSFVLWLFFFYVLFMITSLVEGPFEFPSGAVPFYFFMGFSMGVIRLNFYGKKKSEPRMTEFERFPAPAKLPAL